MQQIYSLEVSVALDIFFKVREESIPASRCAWFLLLQIGQGHAGLVTSYNCHQNPLKVDGILQRRMVLVLC